MPIKFACSCGTQLRIADKDAGRRIKCPKCGDTLTTPSAPRRSTDPDEDEDDRPARRRHDPDDGIVESPRRRPAVADDDDRSSRRRNRDEEDLDEDDPDRDDFDDEEEDRPSRRKKRSRKDKKAWPLVLAIGLGALLLLGGGGFGVWFIFTRGGNVSDLAYVSPDAQGFATLRVADLWKLSSVQKSMNMVRMQQGGEDPLMTMDQQLGLRPEEVERASFVMKDMDQKQAWFVVLTLKPYDKKKVLGKLTSAREVKHEGKTFQVGRAVSAAIPPQGMGGMPPPPVSSETAIYFAGSRVLIMSDEAGMRQCLTDAARKKPTGALSGAIEQAGGTKHLIAKFNLTPKAQANLKGSLAMVPAQFKSVVALLDFNAVSVAADFTDATSNIDADLSFPDPNAAGKAKKSFDALKGLGELFLPPAARGLLSGITADVSGNDLKVHIKIDNKAVEDLMGPNMGGMPGGFGPPPGGNRPPPGGRRPKR